MFKLILTPVYENWNTMVLYYVVLSLELVKENHYAYSLKVIPLFMQFKVRVF